MYKINAELNWALNDLKKLFGTYYTVSDACETIMYQGMTRVTDKNNDAMRPKYMDTRWLVRYTEDRLDPGTVAN